ncbi:MAG: glycosyltransferase family 2 protein [Acidimicrobiia bacterium]
MTGVPFVRVVVVNFNGGDLTLECLHSVLATEWPEHRIEVVLVDNASDDDVVARVKAELPSVRLIQTAENVGFGRANNLAFRDLGGVDHVALINPDARVEPGWLAPLVEALERDPVVGAASPTVLLAGRYRRIDLTVTPPGDARHGGVRLIRARRGGTDLTTRLRHLDGFWGPNLEDGRWTRASTASVLVPTTDHDGDDSDDTLMFELAACGEATVTVSDGAQSAAHHVAATAMEFAVPDRGPARRYLNTAGVTVGSDGVPRDRHYLEPDAATLRTPATVDAWSGNAVLLRHAYLDDVGNFDPALFMYYEDTELSHRGTERGWTYQYVPESVVEHLNSATSVAGSTFSEFHNERSRLLVIARHESFSSWASAMVRSALVALSYARHDARHAAGNACAPERGHARTRWAAWFSALRSTPTALRSRRRDRKRNPSGAAHARR